MATSLMACAAPIVPAQTMYWVAMMSLPVSYTCSDGGDGRHNVADLRTALGGAASLALL